VPILTNRRIEAHRAVIIGTADPARSLLRDIELALALESAGTRGYLLTGEERYAVSHVRARSQRNRALARLLPLARRLSPESYAEATRLARDLAPAEARLDSLYQGLLSGTEYTARLERQQASLQAAFATSTRLRTAIERAAEEHRTQVDAAERTGAAVAVLLVLLGLLAALLVARLARNYRILTQRLEVRLQRQAVLRAVAGELNAATDVTAAARILATRAAAITGASASFVERAETPAPGHYVEVVAATGPGCPPVGTRVAYPGSLTDAIIASGEPAVATDPGAIGQRMAAHVERCCPGCSVLLVPLLSEGRTQGALVLLRAPERGRFTPEDTADARILGDLAAAALGRTALITALSESESRFRQIADHLHEVIWLGAPDLSERYYVNPAYERVWGRSIESFYARPRSPIEAVHPEDRPRVELELKELRNGQYETEYRIIRPDGQIRWIRSRGYPIRNEQGEVVRVAGIMEDITEQKAAEAEREALLAREREAREQVSTILESITDAFYAVDRDWRLTYVNHAAEELSQKPRDQLLGRSLWEEFPEVAESGFADGLRRAMEERRTIAFEARYEPRNIYLHVRAYPSATGLSLFVQNITRRKEAEVERERLLGRERVALTEARYRREELERITESRARLMRGFSHDVKNPLGAADGYLQLLEAGIMGELSDAQKESIAKARRSIGTALGLIQDLLAIARAETGDIEISPAPTDVHAVVVDAADTYRAQAEARGLSLTIETPAEIPPIRSDAGRIRQVLGNLLSNAVKYTDAGRITVRSTVRENGDAPGPGRWVAIDVADTGPGIPESQLATIFSEFGRAGQAGEKHGTGIGLAMAMRIARALDGTITVRSQVGRGSTFTLWLPFRVAEEAHAGLDKAAD